MNIKKIASLAFALSLSIGASQALNHNVAYAAESKYLDLGVDTGSVSYQEYTFYLNQTEASKNEALAEVREIRSKLWDENVIYTLNDSGNPKSERLQDVAKAYGYRNKNDYVNGLTWATDLEKIAIQRAYEQTITGMSHKRPDGSSYSSITAKSGIRPSGEILASSTSLENPAKAFDQWSFAPRKKYNNKSEYQLLLESNGVFNSANGHLHNILNPQFKHLGFAALNNTNSKWNYAVGIFSFKESSVSEASVNLSGDYTLHVGTGKKQPELIPAEKEDKSDADKRKMLEKAIEDAKFQIQIAEDILNNYPNTVKNVRGELIRLIDKSKALIEKAENI